MLISNYQNDQTQAINKNVSTSPHIRQLTAFRNPTKNNMCKIGNDFAQRKMVLIKGWPV